MSQNSTHFFICGSALSGQPDHHTLGEAEFVSAARTKANYRLHNANDGWHPAIRVATEAEQGIAIPGEIYALTDEQLEALLASEPPDLVLSSVELDSDEQIAAMLCPREKIDASGWPDISQYGGWAAFKAASAGQTA